MLTKEQKAEILTSCFKQADSIFGNPGDRGCDPRKYATHVASEIRRAISIRNPTQMTAGDAVSLADDLERGEFYRLFAELMGYCS